jgi:hypothetical protein
MDFFFEAYFSKDRYRSKKRKKRKKQKNLLCLCIVLSMWIRGLIEE